MGKPWFQPYFIFSQNNNSSVSLNFIIPFCCMKHTWMQSTRLTYEIEDRPLENDILSVCGAHWHSVQYHMQSLLHWSIDKNQSVVYTTLHALHDQPINHWFWSTTIEFLLVDNANLVAISFFLWQTYQQQLVRIIKNGLQASSHFPSVPPSICIGSSALCVLQHGWHLSWGPVSWSWCRGLWDLWRMEPATQGHRAVHLFGWIKGLRRDLWKMWWAILARERWWRATRFLIHFLWFDFPSLFSGIKICCAHNIFCCRCPWTISPPNFWDEYPLALGFNFPTKDYGSLLPGGHPLHLQMCACYFGTAT